MPCSLLHVPIELQKRFWSPLRSCNGDSYWTCSLSWISWIFYGIIYVYYEICAHQKLHLIVVWPASITSARNSKLQQRTAWRKAAPSLSNVDILYPVLWLNFHKLALIRKSMEQSTLLSGSLFFSVCQLSGGESNSDQRKTWSKAFPSLSLSFSLSLFSLFPSTFRPMSSLSLFLSPSCPLTGWPIYLSIPRKPDVNFHSNVLLLQSPLTSWPIYRSITWTRKPGPRGKRYPPSLFCHLVHYPAKSY